MIVFITGGARSGKSSYAQNLALSLSPNPVYVATAKNWGGDFDDRIKRHQSDRGKEWTSIEVEKEVSKADIDKSFVDFKKEIDALDKVVLMISGIAGTIKETVK